jgi:hypothetical protein
MHKQCSVRPKRHIKVKIALGSADTWLKLYSIGKKASSDYGFPEHLYRCNCHLSTIRYLINSAFPERSEVEVRGNAIQTPPLYVL